MIREVAIIILLATILAFLDGMLEKFLELKGYKKSLKIYKCIKLIYLLVFILVFIDYISLTGVENKIFISIGFICIHDCFLNIFKICKRKINS